MASILLTSLNTATAVSAGGTVPLGGAVHGYGREIGYTANSVQLRSAGYYKVDVSISATVTGADALTAALYLNGVAVPGATATETPTEAGSVVNIYIPWVIRKGCCNESTALTVVLSVASTVNSMECVVQKL